MDEKLAGEVAAIQGVQHHIVERLCGLDSSDSPQIGFEFKLPDLIEGRHEVLDNELPTDPGHTVKQEHCSLGIKRNTRIGGLLELIYQA